MLQILAAYLVDLIVGDPSRLTHPVVIIGKEIEYLEGFLRRRAVPRIGLRAAGAVLTTIVVVSVFLTTWGILIIFDKISFWAGLLTGIWLLSTTLAVNGLGAAGTEIADLLDKGQLDEARKKVGWIVGRDTAQLDEEELTRAAVETVAENIVDGIISPLFFAFLGGVPLAMAYKAVNTLDSMVGYQNKKYREFGWASARFDDLCNFIPARLTGILMFMTLLVMKKPVRQAFKTVRRDAGGHPSPNSGIPEAVMAGGLGIRLGGLNYYGGVPSQRAFMGDPLQTLNRVHIRQAVSVMRGTALAGVVAGSVIYGIACGFLGRPLWL